MDGSPHINFPHESDWSCPRCHHDLSQLPATAHFCPRCGQDQEEIPLADFTPAPPAPPAPEHFHSIVVVGFARAMTQLGERYEAGQGVACNSDEALRYYCKAARLGNSEARSHLITRGAATQPTSPHAP